MLLNGGESPLNLHGRGEVQPSKGVELNREGLYFHLDDAYGG